MNTHILFLLLLAVLTPGAFATDLSAPEDPERLRQLVADHLARQTAGLPGDVRIKVEAAKKVGRLARCEASEVFVPDGTRMLGNLAVGIRCRAPDKWTTYVRASITITSSYLVAAAPLKPGQVLTADLLQTRRGDLGGLAQDVVTQPDVAIGKVMTTGLVAGAPLRSGMLRAPQAVAQGQGIMLVVKGKGFSISSEGRALNNAAAGQVVQVRTPSGQIVSGIARSGGLVDIAN